LTTAYIIFGYHEFDLEKHSALVKLLKNYKTAELPTVDIFLPCAGEALKTLERTYYAVSRIDYSRSKTNTYILDDKGNPHVKELANKYGFHYLSRSNKGENKKAGNLKFGFEHSNGKYILILDADFAPHQDIIFELLPYLENDEKVGIVQSPQDFILNKDEPLYIQKGDIGVQEFFYRICEVARNTFNASICVGTNAIYKRSALQKSGGFYQIEHSEDAHTGVSLIKNGYLILYIPIILATGYCASDYYGIFKQRSRWCLGSLSLMKSKLFRETKIDYMATLCYVSGFYYYLSSFVLVFLPLHTLWILSTPEKSTLIDTVFFLPNIIYLIISYTTFYYPRFSFSVLGNQFFFYWTYMFVAVKEFMFGKGEKWVATGSIQPKARSGSYNFLITTILIYIAFYWSWFFVIVYNNKFHFVPSDYLVIVWIVYNMVGHISFIVGLIVLALDKFKTSKKNKLLCVNPTLTNNILSNQNGRN
jgi:cellulose synthase (UDP-forming)